MGRTIPLRLAGSGMDHVHASKTTEGGAFAANAVKVGMKEINGT